MNFDFVSRIFFKFQDIAGKMQQKRLKVSIQKKHLQEITIKHKKYSDLIIVRKNIVLIKN